jgi:hypothetical protein
MYTQTRREAKERGRKTDKKERKGSHQVKEKFWGIHHAFKISMAP